MKRPEKKSESLEIRLPYSQKQAFMEACRERGMTASDVLRSFIAEDLEAQAQDNSEERTWTMTFKNNPLKTAAGAASAALAAATFGAGVSFADEQSFERFDANGDGLVSYSEFMKQLRPSNVDVAREMIVRGGEGADDVEVIIEEDGKRIERRIIRGGPGIAPPPPPAPRDSAEELFKGLDRDGSGDLTPEEFADEGRIVRRSDDIIEINGEPSRMLGLEVMTFDVTEAGSVSIGMSALTRTVDPDAPNGVVEDTFRELEDELRDMGDNPYPAPPAPPRR